MDWIEHGEGNATILAVAGSGKTTTLIEGLSRMQGSIAFLAYNKRIAEEIEVKVAARAPAANVRVSTFHAAGYRALRRASGRLVVDAKKIEKIAEAHTTGTYVEYVSKLVSLAKQDGIGCGGTSIQDMSRWQALSDHHGLDDILTGRKPWEPETTFSDEEIDAMVERGIRLSISALQDSLDDESTIDFDDQIFLPIYLGCEMEQFDWVLIDESQDSNPMRRALAKAMLKDTGRLIAVGDPCQPAGTLVTVIERKADSWHPEIVRQVPIEDIRVGDSVVSYNLRSTCWVKGRAVLETRSHDYDDDLVVVETSEGHRTRYTKNHHCLVSFSPLRTKFAVYLMGHGDHYRVGKVRMDYSDVGNGLASRLRQEGGDAVWILALFDTERDALIYEMGVAGRHGLPQLTFKESGFGRTQEDIERMWEIIGSNEGRAEECLRAHGRELAYPLFTAGQEAQRTVKRPIVTEACNLMDGCIVLPYDGGSSVHSVTREDWVPIVVSREPYSGPVYSLAVEGEQLYVADGLVTHNCQAIYGFTGASADAIERIEEDFHTTSLPLTVSFRCPRAVVVHAHQWVQHIEAADTAIEGEVALMAYDDLLDNALTARIELDSAILCRKNAPLVSLAFAMLRSHVPCHVEGRDIGGSIKTLARKWKVMRLTDLVNRVEAYADREVQRLTARKQSARAEAIQDRCDTLIAIASGLIDQRGDACTVQDLCLFVDQLFKDDYGHQIGVTLSSIHKSKGREWPTVYWLGRNAYQPSPFAQRAWQMEQEINLMYVACTRAQKKLVEVDAPDIRKR